jgi:hypothetical protein
LTDTLASATLWVASERGAERLRGSVRRGTAARARYAGVALALGLVGFLAGAFAAAAGNEQVATARLNVHINGGNANDPAVSVTPAPLEGDDHPCRFRLDPCQYTVPAGTVTLSATPTTTPIRWSDPACGSAHVCETTVDADTSIVAVFMPVSLSVQLSGRGALGDGLVRVTEVGCTGADCTRECRIDVPDPPPEEDQTQFCSFVYPTITEVDVEAVPVPGAPPVAWEGLCRAAPGQLTTRCEVGLSGLPARVGFGGAEPVPGFLVSVVVRVLRQGTGGGRVIGRVSGTDVRVIDCPPDCSRDTRYATRLTLTATPDAGSTFDRWLNVCSTDPTCAFSSGAVTMVRAVFRRAEQTTTTTATTTTGPTSSATTGPTTTAPTTTSRPPRLRARINSIALVRVRGRWRLTARVSASGRARATALVLQRSRRIAWWVGPVRAGPNTLRLLLPRGASAGPARLSLSLRDSRRRSATTGARFTVPKRP